MECGVWTTKSIPLLGMGSFRIKMITYRMLSIVRKSRWCKGVGGGVGGRAGGYLQVRKYPGHGNWLIPKRKIPKSGVANFAALATEVKIWQIIDSPGCKEIDLFFSFILGGCTNLNWNNINYWIFLCNTFDPLE